VAEQNFIRYRPRTSDTDYQSTVGVCVDMAPARRTGTAHFGPYKNTSIIERADGRMMRNLFAPSSTHRRRWYLAREISRPRIWAKSTNIIAALAPAWSDYWLMRRWN